MSSRYIATAKSPLETGETDPRLADLGKRIRDEYAHIKDHYGNYHAVVQSFIILSLPALTNFCS